jgi:hypothetical protein
MEKLYIYTIAKPRSGEFSLTYANVDETSVSVVEL